MARMLEPFIVTLVVAQSSHELLSLSLTTVRVGLRMSHRTVEPSHHRTLAPSNPGGLCYSLISTMKDRILKRFNDEIAVLERELKVDLPKEIQRARELGDLRENAEYKAAKERQEIVNARIAMLKRRAGEIALMNLDRIPHDRAGFGSTVELRAPTGENIVYQLVMPEEADVEKGLISTSSPIGRAILNKEEGDEINVTTPSGKRSFELVKLTTIHDE
jgi:transcription elongation factor GreA